MTCCLHSSLAMRTAEYEGDEEQKWKKKNDGSKSKKEVEEKRGLMARKEGLPGVIYSRTSADANGVESRLWYLWHGRGRG